MLLLEGRWNWNLVADFMRSNARESGTRRILNFHPTARGVRLCDWINWFHMIVFRFSSSFKPTGPCETCFSLGGWLSSQISARKLHAMLVVWHLAIALSLILIFFAISLHVKQFAKPTNGSDRSASISLLSKHANVWYRVCYVTDLALYSTPVMVSYNWPMSTSTYNFILMIICS